jgi:hypothetical protein
MPITDNTSTNRFGGLTAILGSVCALSGAGLQLASGADLDVALASGDMSQYLATAGENTPMLVANLVLWIIMVLLMGSAATVMASLGERRPAVARVGLLCYTTGVPLVIAAYVAWLALVIRIAPDTSPQSVQLAGVVGWFASRADWIATILVIGIGPTFLAFAGEGDWAPKWLVRWSLVTAVAGSLNAVAMLTGGRGLGTYGFVIIPAGVGWMIAAGVVLLRRAARH